MKGYWDRIIAVDLSDRTIKTISPDEKLYRHYIGGSGIGARLLFDMTGPETDPLGPDNPIIWMTGPFTGTKVPTSGRHEITSKSPLTGIFGESDAGGRFGTALKRSGLDGLIVKGISSEPVMIVIRDGNVAIESAREIWGKDTFYADRYMKDRFGSSCETSCIGEAGEKLVPISAIGHDGENARMSGRCGFGAVMGSKKLKAVAVLGSRDIEISDPARMAAQQKKMLPLIVEKTKGMHLLGTAGGTAAAEKMGDMPVQNWRRGNWPEAEKISGQMMADTILKKNYYCASCPIGCGRDVEIKNGRWGGVKGAGPEYETLGLMGGSCMVEDLEAITYAADLCNRHGVDTIEAGSSIAMTMECFEKGLLSLDETDGIKAEWGNPEALVALTEKICRAEGIGKLLGLGVAGMAKKIPGSEGFAIHVKGLTLPAHDPRCFNTMAVGYATSNRGACHLAGSSYFFEKTAVMPEFGYEKPRPRYTDGGEGLLNFYAQNFMG
ncbi:MAG: aldehyde ferredoxin oxidoreductase family protein, partial [Synergistaceae bacterium]|nr:aldehyde ferredoxin oxidoreductase family protein [Synergistaceae bacterium]